MPQGRITVIVANEPRRLANKNTAFTGDIQAHPDNDADIYIGSSRHVSSLSGANMGRRLTASNTIELTNENLLNWWMVGSNEGDFVFWGD